VAGEEAILSYDLFEISMKTIKGTGTRYIKKRTGTLKKRFFSAKMMDPRNELDEETLDIDIGDKCQGKLGEYRYWDMEMVLIKTV